MIEMDEAHHKVTNGHTKNDAVYPIAAAVEKYDDEIHPRESYGCDNLDMYLVKAVQQVSDAIVKVEERNVE